MWRNTDYRKEAAKALKLTSKDLSDLGVADEIIPEPVGGAHSDWDTTSENLKESLQRNLSELIGTEIDDLLSNRWAKYEAIGEWNEIPTQNDDDPNR